MSERISTGLLALLIAACLAVPPAAASAGDLKARHKVVAKFEPTWDSFKQYRVPGWYKDGKFGIFIHWGVYSVPAFHNEWYPRNMYRQGSKDYTHHANTYGNQGDFGYKDFIPMFKAQHWDPDRWARLFKQAGAKYVVPVAEHHDGFPMYDCSYTKWNSANMGPKRDVLGELAKAIRKQGLKLGASSHRANNWNYYTFKPGFDTMDPANQGLYGKPHEPGMPASKEFLDDWYARTVEIVDKYHPDLMWFDFGISKPEYEPYLKKFAAYYYNKAAQWGKEVAINYKHEAFPPWAAVLDIERGKLAGLREKFWQTDTSVCRRSWGYIQNHDYKSVDSLVDDLVDIVSKNGCLLLNIGPKPDGTIPEPQKEILLKIGKWLSINGEAIYATRYWKIFGEGPTQTTQGPHKEKLNKQFTARDIRFTTKGQILYAICLAWPQDQLKIKSLGISSGLYPGSISRIRLLGSNQKLQWSRNNDALMIKMPDKKPCDYAYAFKIYPAK